MSRYAQNTSVSTDRSIAEIQQTVIRFGGDRFAYSMGPGGCEIMFALHNRVVRFELILPDRSDKGFQQTETGRRRKNPGAALKLWEQACRQQYRELALLIKAKLVAVQSGITSFDCEFLGNIMLPDKSTVGEVILENVESAYLKGGMPKLLAAGKD